jgi:hypothetical protein
MDIVERLRREASKQDMLACEDMLQAADEIEWLRAERAWRPIETAPKDGTIIYGENGKFGQRGLVHFNSQGEWEMVNGLTNMPIGIGFYPTHWQPLPTPPEGT